MVDKDADYEVCVGRFCFLHPHPAYCPPPFYRRLPGWNYTWKIGAKLTTDPGLQLNIHRALMIPNHFGLGDDAKWKWQWIPLSLLVGIKIGPFVWRGHDCSSQAYNYLLPYVHLKSLTPILGNLALQPMLELLPKPALILKRDFSIGHATFEFQANIEVGNSLKALNRPQVVVKLDWHAGDTVASSVTEVRSAFSNFRFKWKLPVQLKLQSVRVSQFIRNMATRDTPLAASAYLKASKDFGRCNIITVVPGHWIDPGSERGAAGERDFNLQVANVLERQLHGNGWEVLRPDRDAPYLSWEEYLNWVSKQTRKGIPVIEIHGQGSTADYRGLVLGVIGDVEAPLNKELSEDFGCFQMDWRELGVPRRGGAIVECFNADEVLHMAPWHRTWAVRHIANRLLGCIERACCRNQATRGMSMDPESEDLIKPCALSQM